MANLEWGPLGEGWALSLSMDRGEFLMGEKVTMTLITKNASNKGLKLPVLSKWTTYQFQLRDTSGNVPLTRFGQRMKTRSLDSGHGNAEIPAGEMLTIELELNRLFDLSLTGKYALQASRTVPRSGGSEEVELVSNEISFEIVEE